MIVKCGVVLGGVYWNNIEKYWVKVRSINNDVSFGPNVMFKSRIGLTCVGFHIKSFKRNFRLLPRLGQVYYDET